MKKTKLRVLQGVLVLWAVGSLAWFVVLVQSSSAQRSQLKNVSQGQETGKSSR